MLHALLADYNTAPAEEAAKAFGQRKLPEAAEALVYALTRADSLLSSAAGEALMLIHSPRVVEPLIVALQHSSHIVRKAAAGALGGLRDPRAAGPLAELLGDESVSVREAATHALGQIGGREAIAGLVNLLRSPSDDVRRHATYALTSRLHEEGAVAALVACLRDRSRTVRSVAAVALAPLGLPRANRALLAAARRGDGDVAGAAWRQLILQGDLSTETALVAAISRDSPEDMVRGYLYCGNKHLAKAARDAWGERKKPSQLSRGPDALWGGSSAEP
jgi:HEAT repeat protein